MARVVTGIKIERRRVTIRARGEIGGYDCIEDQDDCCQNVGVPAPNTAACCPGLEQVQEVYLLASGPIGIDNAYCTLSADLIISNKDGLSWEGQGPSDCGATAQIYARLWCYADDGGTSHWFISGEYRNAYGDFFRFEKEMVIEGNSLTAEIDVLTLSGAVEQLVIITGLPCALVQECPTCVTSCEACPGISTIWDLSIGGMEIDLLHFSCYPVSNSCLLFTEDGSYTLAYHSASDEWILTERSTGDTWSIAGSLWDCYGPNTLTSVAPANCTHTPHREDAVVIPLYTCDGTGTGGIATECCPDNGVPPSLNAVITNGGSLNGIYPLTYLGGVWDYTTDAPFGTCTSGIARNIIELLCTSGAWSLGVNAPMASIYLPSSFSCNPFFLTFTGVDLSGCGGNSSATITIS